MAPPTPNTIQGITDAAAKKDALIMQIYQKIDSLLGGGPTGQLFCMEFPARSLNYHQYEYDTDSRTSVVSKPFTISDSEFRLVDDLFNVAPIVQGPNGNKLSIVFSELINNYVPKLKELHDFITDKVNIRQWLLTEITDQVNGEEFKGTRMELCKRLYAMYLDGKNKWDIEKGDEYDKRKKSNDLEGFADWLSRTAMVKDQELNNLFNDAVVRGYYHEVLTFLGFLNVSSSAEALETTKQNARNSSRRSLDESMDIFPVQLQPNNWFKAMKPNLSPKDLTMAKDLVIAQYKTKQNEVNQLQSYLVQLESANVSKSDIDKVAAAVETEKAKFQEAESNLIKQYGNGAVGLVKIYLNAQSGGMLGALKKMGDTKTPVLPSKPTAATGDPLGLEKMAQETFDGILKSYIGTQEYLNSAERLAQLRAKAVDAESHEYQAEITRTKQRIDLIQSDLRYLATLAGGVLLPENKPNTKKVPKVDANKNPVMDAGNPPKQIVDEVEEPLPVLPTSQDETGTDGMFMDVVIDSSMDLSANTQSGISAASNSSWKVNLWIGSAGGQSSQQSATSSVENAALSGKFTLGFRVAKVTIDRGGWFNPSIFEMSRCFQRIAESMQASPNSTPGDADKILNKKTILDAISDPTVLDSLLRNKRGDKYMLPAFPIAFVVAKDITIRLEDSSSQDNFQKAIAEQSSSVGGGFLCFSASSASSSKSTSESSYHGVQANFTYIRIPGPQIIGWFMQMTPNDNATKYEVLDAATLKTLRDGITAALENPKETN